MRFKVIALIACFTVIATLSARQNDVVLQNGLNGYIGCDDAYILSKSTTCNCGNEGMLILKNVVKGSSGGCCGKKADTIITHVLVRFDLSSLPPDAVIKEATLSLYAGGKCSGCDSCGNGSCGNSNGCNSGKDTCNGNCGGGCGIKNGPKKLYKVTTAWEEKTVDWKVPWNTAGGDYDPNPVAELNDTAIKVWENFTVASVIQEYVADPQLNNGFLVRFNGPSYSVHYSSSEAKAVTYRPKLAIVYESLLGDPTEVITANTSGRDMRIVSLVGADMLYLSVKEKASVAITDMQGKTIASFVSDPVTSLYQLPLSLAKGLYLVTVRTPSEVIYRKMSIVK